MLKSPNSLQTSQGIRPFTIQGFSEPGAGKEGGKPSPERPPRDIRGRPTDWARSRSHRFLPPRWPTAGFPVKLWASRDRPMTAYEKYYAAARDQLDKVFTTQRAAIGQAADWLGETLARGGWLYAFGTGHS